MYGDYEGIILVSFLTVISSYFAMWCMLHNCLARKNVFKIAKSNGFLRILFLPTMKQYVVEYKKTYLCHSIIYWFSLLQAVCFAAFIIGCKHGIVSLWREAWSFLYLMCAVLLLGMDILAFFTWDSCCDSQADASDRGRYLDDKKFNSGEARERLHRRKNIYITNKDKFLLSKSGSYITKKRLKMLACNMQSIQVWTEYLAKNDLYFSDDDRIQDMEFVSNEWEQIRYYFQKMQMKQKIEQYKKI